MGLCRGIIVAAVVILCNLDNIGLRRFGNCWTRQLKAPASIASENAGCSLENWHLMHRRHHPRPYRPVGFAHFVAGVVAEWHGRGRNLGRSRRV